MKHPFKIAAALSALLCCVGMCGFSAGVSSKPAFSVGEDGLKYIQYEDGSSELYTGWTVTAGKYRYYKEGRMLKNCWLTENNIRRYFLTRDGYAAVGRVTVGGVEYEFDSRGVIMHNGAAVFDAAAAQSLRQAKANGNFDRIQKLFVTDKAGNTLYPEDYSGAWIDGEELCVALTDTSAEAMEKYKQDLPFPENIKFVKTEKSLNVLEKELNVYFELLKRNGIHCNSYVDVQNSKCVLEVINVPVEDTFDILEKLGKDFDKDSVIIKKGSYVELY